MNSQGNSLIISDKKLYIKFQDVSHQATYNIRNVILDLHVNQASGALFVPLWMTITMKEF